MHSLSLVSRNLETINKATRWFFGKSNNRHNFGETDKRKTQLSNRSHVLRDMCQK